MNDNIYNDMAIENEIKTKFGLDVNIKSMIARQIPVSPAAQASVFLSTRGMLYVFIAGKQPLTFGDVKKIVTRMGLKSELFLPPRGETNYFDEVGERKFHEVFPGRKVVSPNDLIFYRTLAPYNPALIQITEVSDGVIKQYDTDSVGHWRAAAKFTYRRIKTI